MTYDKDVMLLARKAHETLMQEGRGLELWGIETPVRDVQEFFTRFAALVAEAEAEQVDRLRTKIEAMEKQEPYSYIYEYSNPIDGSPVWRDKPGYWNAQFPKSSIPLYLAPGAQDLNLNDPAVQERLAAQWGYVPAPSAPEGWKLVPIEPTFEMLHAALSHSRYEHDQPLLKVGCEYSGAHSIYTAMLAAAPEAKP